jgi:hypothetical protein
LILAGLITLPGYGGATGSVVEVVGDSVSEICADTDSLDRLGSWTHNTPAGTSDPESDFNPIWGTPSAHSAQGISSSPSGSATNLSDVPESKNLDYYVAYSFTTPVDTRTIISGLSYGDSIQTEFRIQAQLFSLAGESPEAVPGAESAELTPDTTVAGYQSEDFVFPKTLLLPETAYEMRLYVWSPILAVEGFDDFSILGGGCLPGAPTIDDISVGETTADVAFSPPSVPGGSLITGYEYSLDGATWIAVDPSSTASPLSIPIEEIADIERFDLSLRAVTAAGTGTPSITVAYPESAEPALFSSPTPAPDVQVSVFNMTGLNGTGCAGENENLISIINAVDGYEVDGSIMDFVDSGADPTLASQLASSRFFFMTDMENSGIANPDQAGFLPESAKTAFRNWTNGGGVMVMTGTAGTADVRFLNNIYGWDLVNAAHTISTEVTANTSRTPFANATGGVSLTQGNATDSIGAGTVPNFKPMWVTSGGNAEVAVIKYGSGYVIYLGWDFYASGPGCSFGADPWVTGIVPAALRYATELSESGLENTTSSGGDLKYTFSNSGTTYYVVVPAGSEAPTSEQIKSQSNYGAFASFGFGQGEISADVERVFTISGLPEASDYTVYVVTEYDDGGTPTFSNQQILNFSTNPGVPDLESLTSDDDGNIIALLTPSGSETNFEYSVDGGATWIARSPAATSGPWTISGLTIGTSYEFKFRSVYKDQPGSSTAVETVTPSVAPGYLTNFVPSTGTLSPSFSSGTLIYTLKVGSSISSITFIPTSSGNTIRVAGTIVVSGAESGAIALPQKNTDVTVSVLRSVAGASETIYTIQVVRASSSTVVIPPVDVPSTPVKPPKPEPTPSTPVTPSVPEPTAAPTSPTISLMLPIDPSPEASYSSSDPIPKFIMDILSKPLAYILGVLSGDPELPELSPSESLAYENGEAVVIELVKTDQENGYILRGDGWDVSLEATDSSGSPLILDDSGNIILNKDRFVQFSGTGFAPGSIVKVWIFSDPTGLADVVADSSGNFIGKAQIPQGIQTGEHTIQLNGLTQDGQLRSVSLGVLIQPEIVIAPAPPVGFDLMGLLNILWIIAAGVVLFFFILWRRRKKKEKQGSPVTSGDSTDLIFASESFEPGQQFSNGSMGKFGSRAPANRKRFSFKPKGA